MERDSYIDIEQLIHNPEFVAWVKKGQHSAFWESFKKNNPQFQEQIEFSRDLILGINSSYDESIMEKSKNQIWGEIEAQISQEQNHNRKNKIGILAIIALISLGVLFYGLLNKQNQKSNPELMSQDKWIEYTNHSVDNWPIDLVDGSQIILEPNAYLKYPIVFDKKTRNVQLKGDAYFDIARDTLHPFYVYANEAVIRVLGTSFFVKADNEDKEVKVIVESGKVAVYRKDEIIDYQAKKINRPKSLLVTPNQVATLNKSNLEFVKRLVPRPTLTKPLSSIDKIYFENNTIHEIAKALGKAYGVEIVIDSNITTGCRLTTTLTNQPLFEKLKIICDPLGLKYLEKDVKIHILGNCE